MSDASAFGFGKFVPGFDFLQSLAAAASAPKAPGSATAGMSSWVAPTLNVEELDKRIQELKAVQFWLEQNGTALKATIQALEVQKMTLSTLQGMNVNMAELAKAFTVSTPVASEPAQAQAQANPASTAQPQPQPAKARSAQRKGQAAASAADKGAAVDPMQWWGSLTQQFQNIAAAALQDAAAKAPQASAAATSGSNSAPASGPRAAKPSPSKPATAPKAKRPASRSRRA